MIYVVEDNSRSYYHGSYRFYLYPTEAQAIQGEKDRNFVLDMNGAYHHSYWYSIEEDFPHTLEEVKNSIGYLTSDWFKERGDSAYVFIYDEDGNMVQDYEVIP